MSRMKSIFAVLVVAAVVCIMPQAFAANPTVEVVLAGSSAFWQTAAVAAYHNGVSLVGGTATHHWTSKSNAIQLVDTRPALVGGSNNVDLGTLWVVWDSATPPHVWAMLKVDSIVGARCYFARPACTELGTTNGSTGTLDVAGNKINLPNTAWGSNNDVALPGTGTTGALGIFAGGEGTLNHVGAGASDIRAEDAQFGACRANSALGAGSVLNTGDALDGLGYNAANPAGACPAGTVTLAQGVGSPIASGVLPATGAAANPLAFRIIGSDPFSGTAEPAFKTISVGGEPMVFVVSRENSLKGVHNVSSAALQQVFSGANCDASALGGTYSKGINIFLREPLSGTMNTVEATVFRRPTVDGGTGNAAIGISQETNVGLNNPLQGQAGTCILNPSGTSARYRGVGTGEVIDDGVCASNNDNAANCKVTGTYPTAQDGIAYTFFSYGNISKEANQDEYGYLTLDGIDPIFSSYGNQVKTGAPVDPGQPADGAAGGPGVLPGAANLPAGSCESAAAGFPCSEDLIWAANATTGSATGLSFPNLRNGTYPAWGILRVFSDSGTGGQYAALATLIASSNKTAVGFVPDYVPLAAVASFCSPSGKVPPCVAPDHTVPKDPGMPLLRSHYTQKDGAGVVIGCATAVNSGTTECGGDMGGRILSSTAATQKTITQNVQGTNGFQIRP